VRPLVMIVRMRFVVLPWTVRSLPLVEGGVVMWMGLIAAIPIMTVSPLETSISSGWFPIGYIDVGTDAGTGVCIRFLLRSFTEGCITPQYRFGLWFERWFGFWGCVIVIIVVVVVAAVGRVVIALPTGPA
jgi:hypothetical protein